MARIKDSTIEAIRNGVNLHDLVSAYVSLKKSGTAYKGLSPFTAEKTPSFFVYPDKGFFYCFSTSQGGDIFKFVQMKESLPFYGAVEFIAHKFNIAVEYEDAGGRVIKEGVSEKKQIFDLNDEAAAWFSEEFASDTKFGQEAKRYWFDERKFAKGSEKTLRIGISPVDWSGFKKRIEKKYSWEAIVNSGLFFEPKNAKSINNLMPRFRGRLMIPICDIQGRVVGFTARKMSTTPSDIPYEEGKYVNSPETPVFKKQQILFNFDKARKAAVDKGFFILVEGQIDAMRMFVSGFENTVASQGTAITEGQLQLLRRHSGKLLLLLDGDSAGIKAAKRVLPLAMKADLDPSVCILPKGEDPDTMILKSGKDGMEKLFENRQSAVNFLVSVFRKDFAKPTAGDKRQVLEEIYALVANASSYVIKDECLREAAALLGADYSAVAKDYLKKNSDELMDSASSANSPRQVLTNVATDVLLLCFKNPELLSSICDVLDTEWICGDSPAENLLKRILYFQGNGMHFELSELEDEDERNLAYEIMALSEKTPENELQLMADCLQKIYKNYCEKQIAELEASGNLNETYEQQRERYSKIMELKKLIRDTKFLL